MILIQKYSQYKDKNFKPTKSTTIGSPISSKLAEIFLQLFEEVIIKHWMEIGEITCYRRYVDDIIIIFDENKINEDSVTKYM
jgi:hypothetical protein